MQDHGVCAPRDAAFVALARQRIGDIGIPLNRKRERGYRLAREPLRTAKLRLITRVVSQKIVVLDAHETPISK